jgi:hypothetical protein
VSEEQVKATIEAAAKDGDVSKLEDWYSVPLTAATRDIAKRSKKSLFQLLQIVYPDHKWLPWLFRQPPRAVWDSTENQRQYLQWALSQLKPSASLENLHEWNDVKISEFKKVPKAKYLLERYDMSLSAALRQLYPQHSWTQRNFGIRKPIIK